MYNEEQKNGYIGEAGAANRQLPKWLRNMFGKSAPMETALGKDLAEWTASEIIAYYKSLCLPSMNSLTLRHSQLSGYAKWCLGRHLVKDSQNHYIEIDACSLRGCLNLGMQENSILSREQLEDTIVDLLNPRDQCLVYAIFEGIQGKQFSELTELNMSQLEGNLLHLPNRTIEVSDRLIGLMQEATDEYVYYSYGNQKPKKIPFYSDDGNVFKMVNNSHQTTQIRKRQRLYSNLCRIKEFVGNPAICTQSLIESGRVDMVQALMEKKENQDLNLYGVLKKYEERIANKYGIIYNYKNYILTYGRFYERG